MISTELEISAYDYEELISENGRWTLEEYCYWIAKFRTTYPPEGYGMFGIQVYRKENKHYYIKWNHYDISD